MDSLNNRKPPKQLFSVTEQGQVYDSLNNRNSPFSPFSVNSVTEILLSLYKVGRGSVIFGGGLR